MEYKENVLSYEDYSRLRESVGWENSAKIQAETALQNSLYTSCNGKYRNHRHGQADRRWTILHNRRCDRASCFSKAENRLCYPEYAAEIRGRSHSCRRALEHSADCRKGKRALL